MNIKGLVMCLALLAGAGLYAQNAESDFETDGQGTITKYAGWDAAVVIPARIGGKPVTAISKEAFVKSDLTSVSIPDTVTAIGDSAFANNKLTSVTLGKGVTAIGASAFASNQLTSVTLPGSVTFIGASAFASNQLTSVTLPGSVTFIGERAFSNNQLTGVTLPGSVTSIGERAFSGNKLTSVTIPGSARISSRAFYHSKTLKSVTLGNNLIFGTDAFTDSEYGLSNTGANLFYDYVCNDRKAGTYTVDPQARQTKQDGDFQYIETKYGAYITGYSGSSGNRLQIPDKAGGACG